MLPQLGRPRWQQGFGNLDQLTHDCFRLWTKRKIDSSPGAKEICNDGKAASLHSLKEQCRPTTLNDAPVNLSHLEIGINFRLDCRNFVFPV